MPPHFQTSPMKLIMTQTCQRLHTPGWLAESRNSLSSCSAVMQSQIICGVHCSQRLHLLFLLDYCQILDFVIVPVAGSVSALRHPYNIWIKPLQGQRSNWPTFVSVFVLHQCSCVLRLSPNCPEADVDICIYLFKLWLLLVISQCANRHFYLVL